MVVHRRRSARGIATAVLALALWGSAAHAQTVEDARAHYERANAAFALGNYSKAAEEFEKTFDLKPDPALLYNAAQAHRLGGNKSRALLLYQNYVRIYGDRVPNVEEVKRHIADLKVAIASDERSKTSPPMTPRAAEPLPTPAAAKAPAPLPPPPPEHAPAVVEKTPAAGPAAPPKPRPLVKRAWFWVAVVGAAAVVGTAVALGVTLGSSTKDPTPSYGVANGN